MNKERERERVSHDFKPSFQISHASVQEWCWGLGEFNILWISTIDLSVRMEPMEGTSGGKAVQALFLQLVTRSGQNLVHPGATLCASPDTSALQKITPSVYLPLLPLSHKFLVHLLPPHNTASKQYFCFDWSCNPHTLLCWTFPQVCESTFIILWHEQNCSHGQTRDNESIHT